MPIPLTFTNRVTNPAPKPNGLGAETRRNLVTNPAMASSPTGTVIRINRFQNPSLEKRNLFDYDYSNGIVFNSNALSDSGIGAVQGVGSLKLIPTGSSNNSYIAHGNGTGARKLPDIPAGSNVTVTGTITIPQAQTGTLYSNARRIVIVTTNSVGGYAEYVSAQAPNSPGTYTVTASGPILTGANNNVYIRIFNGSSNVNDVVYWDNILVTSHGAAAANTDYFDGSTPRIADITGDLTHEWVGTPDNSQSRERAYAVQNYIAVGSGYTRYTTYNSWVGTGCLAANMVASSAAFSSGVSTTATLAAATQYTLSTYVYLPSGAASVRLQVTGGGMTQANSSAMATTGSWQRVSVTFTTVAAGTYTLALVNTVTTPATLSTFLTDAWQVETGATATAWFSGNSTAANLSYQWLGTEANSISTETGLAMPGYVGANANVVAALPGSTYKIGVIPTSASTASKAYVGSGPGTLALGMEGGKTYYVRARLQLTAALTGTPDVLNKLNMTFYSRVGAGTTFEQRTASSTNAIGTYTHEMIVSVPTGASEAYLSLNNGYPTGGGTVFWDQVMITEGAYVQTLASHVDQHDPGQFATNNVSLSSNTVSDKRYLTLTATSGSTFSFARWTRGEAQILPGKSYRFNWTLRVPAVQTGTVDTGAARRPYVAFYDASGTFISAVNGQQAPNIVGTYSYTMDFTAPAGTKTVQFRLYHGGTSTGGGLIQYNDLVLKDKSLTDYSQLPNAGTNMIPNGWADAALGTGIHESAAAQAALSITSPPGVPGFPQVWSAPAGTPTTAMGGTGAWMPVTPGAQYVFEFWVKADVPNSKIYVELRDNTGAHAGTPAPVPDGDGVYGGNSVYPIGAHTVPTVWTKHQTLMTINAGVTTVRIATIYFNHTSGPERNAAIDFVASMYPYTPKPGRGFFDGNNPPVDEPNKITRWLGTPNLSASQFLFRGLWLDANTSVSPPRVVFTVAGLGINKVSQASLRRVAGGQTTPVPGWLNKNVVDISAGVDWLVPLNTPVEYQLWVDGSQIDAQTISFTSPAAWIADPLVPSDAMPIYTVPTQDYLQLAKDAMAEKTYDAEVSTETVMGSRYPLARTGPRQLLQGIDLTVNAPSNVTSDQFFAMISNAPILCIRTHPSWGNMPPIIYVAASVVEAPLNRQRGGGFTVWKITGDVVAPVSRGPIQTGVTHAQVQTQLTGRTHQSIRDVASARRWVDIMIDPLSLGG